MAYTDIDDPTAYFKAQLYTGDGGTTQAITFNDTDTNMQPDWVWIKMRSETQSHILVDSVRGVNKYLGANHNGGEGTDINSVTAFGSDGFTVGNDDSVNKNTGTYVAWDWKGGGSASANSDGSTASSVSANTTAGFSIVGYTGAGATTYGHGLGATPNVIIIKKRTGDSGNNNWFVYHDKVITAGGSNKSFLTLNETGATTANGSATTFTSVSSTTFGVGTDDIISESSHTFIAYCFAEVKGYSKFGSYTGNATGGNEGPFIYTGFKPAWVMIKNASAGSTDWLIYDNKRGGPAATVYGNNNKFFLKANENDAEANETFDMYSNGFKIRITNNFLNGDGNTLIYMAFAESPFVSSNKIPTNAR